MISRPVSVNTKYSVARQSALGRAWREIRPEMTLSNYDKEVVCCRGEAAGPIADVAFQMMRRGLQRQSSRWSRGRAETHASPGHQMSNRPSEPRMRRTAKLLQGGRACLATHILPFGHGVAEKPWGRPILQAQDAASSEGRQTLEAVLYSRTSS